jgi:SAM-dependent methyltransferase
MDQMLAATAATEDRHFWFRGLRRNARTMLQRAGVKPGLSLIVDCGAGTGRNLDWLSSFGPAVGVDLTPLALRIGHEKRRPLVRGTVTALPFPSRSADLATSFDVLYCLDDESERRALREMWRILKPGGHVLINVAALDMLRGSHSALTHEVRRYSPGLLRDRLAVAGFEVEHVTFTNLSLFAPMLAVRGLQRITGRATRPSDADLAVPVAPVNVFFNGCLAIEARVLSVANLPVGTSVMAIARKPF